jgi:hypothetical protein
MKWLGNYSPGINSWQVFRRLATVRHRGISKTIDEDGAGKWGKSYSQAPHSFKQE